jgi:hypothetical protein
MTRSESSPWLSWCEHSSGVADHAGRQARLAWTVPVCGGPGSAVHHSREGARAAPHPGHTPQRCKHQAAGRVSSFCAAIGGGRGRRGEHGLTQPLALLMREPRWHSSTVGYRGSQRTRTIAPSKRRPSAGLFLVRQPVRSCSAEHATTEGSSRRCCRESF